MPMVPTITNNEGFSPTTPVPFVAQTDQDDEAEKEADEEEEDKDGVGAAALDTVIGGIVSGGCILLLIL
jgi:hypothetical protein